MIRRGKDGALCNQLAEVSSSSMRDAAQLAQLQLVAV